MITPCQIAYGDITYPPGGTLGPRWQHELQLVLVYEGQMTASVDGIEFVAGANTTSLLLPGHSLMFKFAPHQETHHTWVHIPLTGLTEDIQQRLSRVASVIPLSPTMDHLMSQLQSLRLSNLPTVDEIAKSIAAQMLWYYIGEAEQLSAYGSSSSRTANVDKATHYIKSRLNMEITLPDIAEAVALSPTHLIRLFRQVLGVTPMEYVWQQRVARGVDLLEQTGLTVKEVAACCGFQTSYHFSRRVKQSTGLTPTGIRQQI